MLREAQDSRHQIPDGDIAVIFERALTLLVAELRKSRHGAVNRPRETSHCSTGRHVPASVKRAVWERDQGQCAFVGAVGRCTERGFLEYHHRVPYADGGATNLENLELRCRAHNAYEAKQPGLDREEGGSGSRGESELHAAVTREVQLRPNFLRRRVEAEHVLHAGDVLRVNLRHAPHLLLPRFEVVLRQPSSDRVPRNARVWRQRHDRVGQQRQRPPGASRRRGRARRRDQQRFLTPA